MVYDAHVLTSSSCCCFETGRGCFGKALLAGLFIIFHHTQQFRSRQNRRQCKGFTSVLGGFDLRACVCFVTWGGRGMVVGWSIATKLVLQF